MDGRILEVWRLTWPKAIPAHEYETALQMAALVGIAGRKPELAEPRNQTLEAASPGDLASSGKLSALAKVSLGTISTWAARGLIRKYGSGAGTKYSRAEVLAFAASRNPQRQLPLPRLVHSAPEGEPGEAPAGGISVADAANEYRISRGSLYKAVRDGALKPIGRSGKGRAFARADIEAWNAARMAGEGA